MQQPLVIGCYCIVLYCIVLYFMVLSSSSSSSPFVFLWPKKVALCMCYIVLHTVSATTLWLVGGRFYLRQLFGVG